MILIPKYSLGVGDRFSNQGEAQLLAFIKAAKLGISITPVWNKSNREHLIIGSDTSAVRLEAESAVANAGWTSPYFVDADHINLSTVDRFIGPCDFFTIDVAEFTGCPAEPHAIEHFLKSASKYAGGLTIAGLVRPLVITHELIEATAIKFLRAIQEAGEIYRRIAEQKGPENFVTEISVDETDTPQSPAELFLILNMIALQGIPVQTIAPKFTGRFNKGVEYAGNLAHFEQEFDDNLSILAFAVKEFNFPRTLKLSVHSGSDKFSLYPIINRLIKKHGAGLHVKTAGTTWLEEVIGLAESGNDGLEIAKEIYRTSIARFDELTKPYETVIDISKDRLPSAEEVNDWDAEKFASTLRHDSECRDYNPDLRQLIHVGFKVAANMGTRYTDAIISNRGIIGYNVTHNLFQRHILPIFG